MFRLGYNTNGFAFHALDSSLEIISTLGYRAVAITLDNYILNPWDPELSSKLKMLKNILKQRSLTCVIETGARFLLDPWHKHEPTLISRDRDGRNRRVKFLKKALDIAAELEAEALSFWAGVKQDQVDSKQAWAWLISGCREVTSYARKQNVRLAFEPEPGMFIESLADFQRLKEAVADDVFGLTLDVGHVFLTENQPVGDCIRVLADDIKNIHIEDMRRGTHQHLFFGEGEINFTDIFTALKEINYDGPLNVELSRHSHDAVSVAKGAFKYLRKYM